MQSTAVKRAESSQQTSGCDKSGSRDLWLHIRILYALLTLLFLVLTGLALLGFYQVTLLRRDFEGEIVPRGVVEFSDNVVPRRKAETDSELPTHPEEDQLIRVRRETKLRGPDTPEAERWAKEHENLQKSGPFFYGGRSYGPGQESEGGGEEGSGTDDWVWLTSYSRIPIFALQDFCAATRDYCPPAPMGPVGLPGLKGERGEIGYTGLPGEPGPSGSHGADGFNGEKGDPGAPGHNGTIGPIGPPGTPGLPGEDGLPGTPGEPGFNGTDGRRGRRGRPGKDGLPGLKGDEGPPAPRGHKGDRGPVGPLGPAGLDALAAIQNCTCPIMEGPPGPVGLTGPTGPRGPKGDKGEAGSSNLRLESAISTTRPTTAPTTPEAVIAPRDVDCDIRMIGKPVFQRYTGTFWGAWMRDARPPAAAAAAAADKYWFTRHFTGNVLYEYHSFEEFRHDRVAKTYSLTELYFGTGHVVYGGSFFYQRAGNNELIKYDLSEGRTVAKTSLWQAAFTSKDYVYSTEYNYFDLAVDENGLWAIYGAESEPWTLLVSKLLPDDLTVEKTWNITVERQQYGNGFITCGVLYLIKDTQAKSTVIDFAYDLYTKENKAVRLKFTNPFEMNNMVTYNPSDSKLYCWDKGNQLIYPLLL